MSLEALENAVLAAAPDDVTPVAGLLLGAAPDAPQADAAGSDFDAAPADLISVETWCEQWAMMHDMAGGMVQMRTGNPCPLGDQARSAGGQVAAQACYGLLASTPVLANMFLGQNSTMFGQAIAIGMHGFACVQMIKTARAGVAE